VAILWRAAYAKMNTRRLRGICARAMLHLLDDGQGAEMSPDQWLELLLPVIHDSVRAIDGETDHGAEPAGHDEEPQARSPAAAA